MARRIRRKARLRLTGKLTSGQQVCLMAGLEFAGESLFDSPDDYVGTWWRHRADLMSECRPFRRPEAYWTVELDIPPPGCPASTYRTEREALLKLELELTVEEKTILRKERENPRT